MSSISKSEYDLLDLKETRFETDYGVCFSGIEDLESRIGTVISQAFDDTPCLYSCFRLIESFGQLATRKLVKKDFEPKYFVMLSFFSKDLNDVGIIFNTHKDSPPIHSNMAPLTGALSWIHELKDRIKHNFERFQGVFFSSITD
jgi:dynein heavy chain